MIEPTLALPAHAPGPEGTDRRPGPGDIFAGLLLAATVALHIIAMFPVYFARENASLASQSDQATLFAIIAAGWALTLIVGLTGPARLSIAAALAAGIAGTELGFRFVDLGDVFRYGSAEAGNGLWLMTAAWGVGVFAAAALAVAARRHRHLPLHHEATHAEPAQHSAHPDYPAHYGHVPHDEHTPRGAEYDLPAVGSREGWTAAVVLLAAAAAGAFLPPWDHYRAVSSVTGNSYTRDLGNAFTGNPWQITLGNVLAASAILIIPIIAIRLKNRHVGAALAVGCLIVLAAQLASAVVQVDMPVSPALLGIPANEAQQLGVTVSLRLTAWFVLDAIAAFGIFAAMMVWATLRVDHENSPGTLPSPPAARSDSIPWAS